MTTVMLLILISGIVLGAVLVWLGDWQDRQERRAAAAALRSRRLADVDVEASRQRHPSARRRAS